MGRKGMKGFLKGVSHKAGPETDDQEEEQPSAAPAAKESKAAAAPAAAKAPAAPVAAAKPAQEVDDDDSDAEESSGKETRGKMLQRHKKEMQAFKKQLQRMGKKSKDELAKMTAEVEARHAKELAELEQQESSTAAATEAMAAMSVAPEQQQEVKEAKKPSKGQKRREKLAQQEAEREARIAAETEAAGPSDKMLEEEKLARLLEPHGLQIKDVRADGHCMYRALEHQLKKAGSSSEVPTYQQLRKMAADFIRQHPDDFVPFLMDEEFESDDLEAELLKYCEKVSETAAWGGQVELGALARALQRQIKVYAVGMPVVTLGDEFSSGGVLEVCYLRHAFGLGEHYNSVEPLVKDDEDGEQQDESS